MVRKNMDEKICRDCGKSIIGRRVDAIVCKGCRRIAQEEASRRIKRQEKGERILKKVEGLTEEEIKEMKELDTIWKDIDAGKCESYTEEEFFKKMKEW